MKPPASGSGSKNKKPYYLTEAMQFTLPFIKTLGSPVGNLYDCPQQCTTEVTQDCEDSTQTELDITNDERDSQLLEHVDDGPSSQYKKNKIMFLRKKRYVIFLTYVPLQKKGKLQKRINTDVDKSFIEYLNMKKKKNRNNFK